MKYAPLYDLLRQASINTENQFMDFYDSSWKYFPDTGISKGAYIIFYRGVKIDHRTHIPGPVAQSSAESEYNAECTAGMTLARFRMLINELLNNDPDIFTEEDPLIVLDIKYTVCMARNGKGTNNTRHIDRRVHLVRNGKKCKMHNIDWCEGGLQFSYIATKNVGKNDLNPRIKYIMVRLDNRQRTLLQEG